MGKKYVIIERENYENHAGAKARNDIAQILTQNGWTPMRVTKGDGKGFLDKLRMCVVVVKDWFGVCCKTETNAEMIVQYPLATYPKVSMLAVPFLKYLVRKKKVTLIYLIHDMDSMRTLDGRSTEKKGEMAFFELASGMIDHNGKMTAFIRKMGISCPITEIGIFDYLTELPLKEQETGMAVNKIAVAGNLNKEKAGYLYEMEHKKSSLEWQVYGPNFEGTGTGTLHYQGQFPAEQLPGLFTADFGLVWDGDSCQTCSGRYGKYLRYNNPHKMSLYLASGMPVIVWDESALAGFVREQKVGFAVHSLDELEVRIQSVTPDEYQVWKQNACRMAERLRNGKNTLEAVARIEKEIKG